MLFSSYFATQVGMYLWKLACPWHNHPAEHILSNKMTKLLLVFCLPQQDYSLVSRLPSTRPMSFSLFSVYFLCDKGFLPACPDNLVISFPAWILELVQEIKYQFLQCYFVMWVFRLNLYLESWLTLTSICPTWDIQIDKQFLVIQFSILLGCQKDY